MGRVVDDAEVQQATTEVQRRGRASGVSRPPTSHARWQVSGAFIHAMDVQRPGRAIVRSLSSQQLLIVDGSQ